jgi:hypothetical protein
MIGLQKDLCFKSCPSLINGLGPIQRRRAGFCGAVELEEKAVKNETISGMQSVHVEVDL